MIKLIIRPRQSGKTTYLFNECEKDPTGVFVSINTNNAQAVKRTFAGNRISAVITPSDFVKLLVSPQAHKHTYYIDEYFFLSSEIKKLLFNLHLLAPFNIVASGTPTRMYCRSLIEDVCQWWKWQRSRKHQHILLNETEMVNAYGEGLVYNLLVMPDAILDLGIDKESHRKIMSTDQFNAEVLGQIYKETC